MGTLVSKRDTKRSVPPPPVGSAGSLSRPPPPRPSYPPPAATYSPPAAAAFTPPAQALRSRPPSLAPRAEPSPESQPPPPPSAPVAAKKSPWQRLPSKRSVSRVALILASLSALLIWFWPVRSHVVTTTTGPAAEIVYATGTIEKENRIQVRVKPGGTVTHVYVQDGQVVKAGQPLAKIDNPAIVASAKTARNNLETAQRRNKHTGSGASSTAQLQMQNAEREFQDTKRLVESGTLGAGALRKAEVAIAQARANFKAANGSEGKDTLNGEVSSLEGIANAANAAEADLELKAPFDGIVLQSLLKVGDTVGGGEPAFGFARNSEPVASVSVDESSVGRIHPRSGDKPGSQALVTVLALDRRTFTGEVLEVASEAERALRTFRVKVRLDENVAELRSGMSVEANLIAKKHENALLVPSLALDTETSSLWVVEGYRARKKAVRIGIRDLVLTEIEAGLEPGARIVVQPESQLHDGMFVWAR